MDILHLLPAAALDAAEAVQRDRFVRRAFGPRARELGFARRAGEGVDAETLRPLLLRLVAVEAGDPSLRRQANALARAWLADEHAVAPEVLDAVLAAAAKSNDAALFGSLLERARAATDHRVVERLLRALGAFTAPALVAQAQVLVRDSAFDLRESLSVLDAQFEDRDTRESAWRLLAGSFDALAARLRGDEVTWRLFGLARAFCDEEHRRAVQALLGPRAERFDGGPHALSSVTEAIGQCAAGFARNERDVDALLAR
jgi:alanyl aminopeptidase